VFEIGTNSDRLRANLDYLVQDAAQEYDVEAVIRIEVLYEDGEYIVTEDGRELSRELCAEHTMSRIFGQTWIGCVTGSSCIAPASIGMAAER
jgi:hypothetical protein